MHPMDDYSLFDVPPINLDNEHLASFNRMYGPYMRAARSEGKPANCLLCGKEASSFCNSHSIPQFCLKQIALKGKVDTMIVS